MFVLLLLACCCASALAQFKPYYYPEEADLHFEAFMSKFNKQYASEEEKAARFEIFKASLVRINNLNLATNMTVYGVTQFSDLTREEFIQKYTGFKPDAIFKACPKVYEDKDIPSGNAPDSYDWRQKNVVNPPKSQRCSDCYAFSTVGSIESQYMIKHGNNVSLSEQQIVDCDKTNGGCKGGLMSNAMISIMKIGGIASENDYPYEGTQADKCGVNIKKAVVKLSSCNSYNLTSQEKVKEALYKYGPISIAIAGYPLQDHSSGIVLDTVCNSTLKINHAVLLVGYGSDASGHDYWIVKNSWGTDWREDGYFRMQRSSDPKGACGMLNFAMASPIVE